MIDDERMLASTTARWCSAGALVAAVSVALAIVALVALVIPTTATSSRWPWWIVAALGVPGTVYAFRLAFDAGVFRDLAVPAQAGDADRRLAAFDAALATLLGGTPRSRPVRALPARVRGASRLVVQAAIAAAIQFGVALFATFPR